MNVPSVGLQMSKTRKRREEENGNRKSMWMKGVLIEKRKRVTRL